MNVQNLMIIIENLKMDFDQIAFGASIAVMILCFGKIQSCCFGQLHSVKTN